MTRHARVVGLVVLCGILVWSPARAEESLTGTWQVEEIAPAPWVAADAAPPGGPLSVGTVVTFVKGEVEGPPPIGCTDATYEFVVSPPQGLFQGALAKSEADDVAAALGMESETLTLRVACETGIFDYHQAGEALVLGFDNAIYRFTRP